MGREGGGKGGDGFGKKREQGGAVEGMAGGITVITVEQRGGKSSVRGETAVNDGSEHLLIAQIWLNPLVGGRTRISSTAETVKAHGSDLRGEIRILQEQTSIERRRTHLPAMKSLGIAPVVGLVLITISGVVDAKQLALRDIGVFAEQSAGSGFNGVLEF